MLEEKNLKKYSVPHKQHASHEKYDSAQEALTSYFEPVTFNDYNCNVCGTRGNAIMHYYIMNPPPILVLNIKRYDMKEMLKYDDEIINNETIDIGDYTLVEGNNFFC